MLPQAQIDQATGVSIQLLPDGNWVLTSCTIMMEKEQVTFGKQAFNLTDLEEVQKNIDARSLIALNLTGKGVLTKQVPLMTAVNVSNFSKLLPDARFEDFYIQHFPSDDQSFVSMIRKADADQWINRLMTLGYRPMLLSLDAFPVELVLPQFNINTPELSLYGHAISRNERLFWTGYRKFVPLTESRVLKIQKEKIDERAALPYAAALGLVMAHRLIPVAAEMPELGKTLNNELETRKLKRRAIIFLCVLFLLLLINFATFSWLGNLNTLLIARVGEVSRYSVDRGMLEEQIRRKESLLRHTGWNHGITKSGLVDQAAALLPAGVSWTAIAIDPLDPLASRMQKDNVFADHSLRFIGTAEEITRVNEWLARLKTKPWVKRAQLINYGFNQELNTGQFTIIINY